MAESRCCITNNGKYDTEYHQLRQGILMLVTVVFLYGIVLKVPSGDFHLIPHAPLGG